MLDDVKCIEKNPQWMRRIRQPPVSERVPGKQVAELVVNLGLWHVLPRQERHSRKDRHRANGHYRKPPVYCKPGKLSLHPGQYRLTQSWLWPDERQTHCENNPFQFRQGNQLVLNNKELSLSHLLFVDLCAVKLYTTWGSLGKSDHRHGFEMVKMRDFRYTQPLCLEC